MASSAIESHGTRRVRVSRLLLATAVAALGAACATPAPKGPLLLHPVPPTAEKYSLSQGAIVFAGPDFTVSARPWDYRLVAEEFRRSGEPSPFGDDEAAVGRFLFFRVRLENASKGTLVFNPMRVSLLRANEAPLAPLENSDIFMFTGDDPVAADARGRAFRRVCFDTTATIRPGQSIERYLVFRAPEEPTKKVMLVIDDLWLGSTSFTLEFPFEAFPGK